MASTPTTSGSSTSEKTASPECSNEISDAESKEFSSNDLDRSTLFGVALHEVGQVVLKAIFMMQYLHKDNKSLSDEDKPITLAAWLKNCNISSAKRKLIFGGRFKMGSGDPTKGKFDFVTYHRFITAVNLEFYREKYCAECTEEFDKILSLRNNVCHYGPLHSNENDADKLLVRFKKLLECASKDLGYESKYIEPVEKDIQEVMNCIRRSTDMLNVRKKIMIQLADDPCLSFLRCSQYELSQRNDLNRKFSVPFYWIHDVTKDNKGGILEPISMDVYAIPCLKRQSSNLSPKDIFLPINSTTTEPPQVMLVHGNGGCGKTTLSYHIFSEWHNKSRKSTQELLYYGLDSFDLVVLVEMRATRYDADQECKSLMQFLDKIFLPNSVNSTHAGKKVSKNVPEYLLSLKTLYIIDGFDEKNSENVELVRDIATFMKSRSNHVILTTRPEFLCDAQKIFRDHTSQANISEIQMIGFDEEGRKDFSEQFFASPDVNNNKSNPHKKTAKEFCDFMNQRTEILNEYLNFPLTVALLILLFLKCDESILNAICSGTKLYLELFNMLTSKLVKARKHSATHNAQIRERDVAVVLDELARIAKISLFSPSFRIEINNQENVDLNRACEKRQIVPVEFFSAFLLYYSPETSEDDHPRRPMATKVETFSFFHRTEMEFLAGKFLAKKLASEPSSCQAPEKLSTVEELVDEVRETYHKLPYSGVLPFLVGCLAVEKRLDKLSSGIADLVRIMNFSSDDFNLYSKLVIESHTHKGSEQNNFVDNCRRPFCTQIADLMHETEWHLSADTVLAGLRLLKHCFNVSLQDLTIDLQMHVNPDNANDHLSSLHTSLSQVGLALRQRRRNKISMCFHLQNHYENDGGKSEKYLAALDGWANLVKFTGAINREGVNHLSTFKNLKFLSLRISTSEDFNGFIKHCYMPAQQLKQLRLVLAFPTSTKPSDLEKFERNTTSPSKGQMKRRASTHTEIHLRFDRIKRASLPWALNVIEHIWTKSLGGFDRITFRSLDFDRSKDPQIIRDRLKNLVFVKVTVLTKAQRPGGGTLELLSGRTGNTFEFEWDDR
ncbi:uncharacterized protein LOC108671145 [Hyalella azteca]|uniref:Uncharacterized protein LOC108671145 n=1 Tax=Hyalella azteca TaxID=294128 RepID=A0A8B7NLI5_HYAAZ|nr:uncharacterized protein LOC108671145 [Hyalella azteca]XP_018014115.1 uncharacterized protein LOC108671145 [Hyalella azteca]XP_018014117.1 uncharacterized protein LOC108671145 [Hyalella azteca]XP_047741171.1 uncharacterized protein LOC108671145 [Hyalella azteca]XP_047741172.1 uncharacterized protein LOC108671145 [Hyalella azteca]XP_047741173.1 uncharacterized protein LOC108671145 [Hyalella azteca]XP_047741174.1 uncharacterized protein LOC108671145 [Hyalella azteca]